MCVFHEKKKKSFTLFSLMLFSVHFWCITCQKNALITCQTTIPIDSPLKNYTRLLIKKWPPPQFFTQCLLVKMRCKKKSTMGQFSGVFCCIYRCIKHFTHHNTCVWTQPEALLTWYSFTFLKLNPERNLNRKVQGKACSFFLNLISVLNKIKTTIQCEG